MPNLDNVIESPPQQEQQKNSLDIFEKLFTGEERETKTELSAGQVVELNKKRAIAELLDWQSLNNVLDDFMLLQISKDRMGRKEFIEGLKSERERETQQTGFFQNLKSRFFNSGG